MDEEKNEQSQNDVPKETVKSIAEKGLKGTAQLTIKATKLAIKVILIKALPIIAAIILIILIASFLTYLLKQQNTENLTYGGINSLYSALDVIDVSELVTVNGTPQDGYSLAFVEDIDEKLEEVLQKDTELYNAIGVDGDTLKEYIKAEVVTQFPYLGEGIDSNKLPNLDGVDILNEQLEEVVQVESMNGFLMIGDSFTVGIRNTGMLEEVTYCAEVGATPQTWLDRFNELPSEDDVKGVCVLLGVNNTDQVAQMKELIDKLCDKYEGKPIYIQRVFPLGASTAGNATMEGVNNFNTEISQYCEGKENLYWIDTTNGYLDEGGLLITNDSLKLHPNEYQTLVNNIKNIIVAGRGQASGSSGTTELQGSNSREAVWNFFTSQGFGEVATAGIMGNFSQESGFASNNVENGVNTKTGWSDEEFTERVNNGTISRAEFIASSSWGLYSGGRYGYGLAQWTDTGRKTNLYDYSVEENTGIDDLLMQLKFVLKEIEESFPALQGNDFKNISSVEQATVDFHNIYEVSNDTAAQIQERVDDANAIFEEYEGTSPTGSFTYSSGSYRNRTVTITDRDIPEEEEFEGTIKLKRVIPDKNIGELSEVNGRVIEMTFVPEGVFNAYLNQNNLNVLEVYTLNSNRELVYAKWTYDSDTGIKLQKAPAVDFCTVMEKYTMPYDYLMMLNVQSEDSEFCVELANLAMESEYVIAIQDETTTTRNVTTYEEEDEEGRTYTYQITKYNETDSQNVELTYADSWVIKVENDISYSDEYLEQNPSIIGESSTTSSTIGNTTTTTVINRYQSGSTTVYREEAGDKFVELYQEHERFRTNLQPDWLFESLNKNSRTVKLVDITKYILYKADNQLDYGVKNPTEVFNEYSDNAFEDVDNENNGTIVWEFIKAWENNHLRKYMNDDGTYSYNDSTYIYSSVTEDREKYILRGDIGQYEGNRFYGFVRYMRNDTGYGWQFVDKFEEQGIFIKESEYNVVGESQIDANIVDIIANNIIEEYQKNIENIAEQKNVELEDYQIDCLTDILYEGYNINEVTSIIEAYEEYLEGNINDEELRKTTEAFDESARGNARWTLFIEGIYTTPIEGENLDPNNFSGGGEFVEVAGELWQYLCDNSDVFHSYGAAPSGFPYNGPTIDCSAYVSWVLYNCGYSEFSYQHNTAWFIANADACAEKYGWEIIRVSQGQNVSDILQAGDILVRDTGSGGSQGHMNIAVSVENGTLMAYDCGGSSGWLNANGQPIDRSYFLADSSYGGRPGVIIRGIDVIERREAGT